MSLVEMGDKRVLRMILTYLVEERRLQPKSVGNYFTILSAFFDFLAFEEIITSNTIPTFRKRYLRQYKRERSKSSERKAISRNEMANLINSILDPRDRAIITLLAKTGIRRNELIQIDLDDIDWADQRILLQPHPKRSNRTVFFDDECAIVLRRWLRAREHYRVKANCHALFVNERGARLRRQGVYHAVTKHAERVGLHDPSSQRMQDRFTPHNCRHWFTTYLRKGGMRREFIKELRGDVRREAMDIYDHIDDDELKRAYLAAIPPLGIAR
jgi:integrase/recombinase XerD